MHYLKIIQFIVMINLSLLSFLAQSTIRIGTVIFEPPFVLSPGTGFDFDLMRKICQGMHEQCEFISMDYNQLFDALDKEKIDLAIGSISISSSRKNKYIFSESYLASRVQFLALNNNKFNSVSDLTGYKVGVIKGEESGGYIYDYLRIHFSNQFEVVAYRNMEDVIYALVNGQISAAFLHVETASYWLKNSDNQFKVIDKPIALLEGVGIMALPKNIELIKKVNQQLQLLKNSGFYLDLYKLYLSNSDMM